MPGSLHSIGTALLAPQKRQFAGGDGGGEQADKRARTDAWKHPQDVVTNGMFEEYYKEQGVCPPEVRRLLPPPPPASASLRQSLSTTHSCLYSHTLVATATHATVP